ncbi:alpha-ketoglutarate decarboxylase [Yeosuana sp. MJ-SS3]|uniref:Alpha-ketoglutarate decarboxylase n=1 Tax=Gilvirhabdus luticola TaxID=3079858 RepID=A0ABU3U8J3_9FLAO|nr:alpha-ketoglutarate decarboxylase [Yeosuana sp. MJ-SS3]MDU8886700.1 alpha-ketoglutarate decarboxylase [Yeosuana sp. MJ-SS3]
MKNTLKKRIKLHVVLFIFYLFSTSLICQNNNNGPSDFWNHVRFGGGVGLSFGNGFFSGTLAPSAIYQFNPQVALGVGLSGTYNTREDFYRSTIIGGSIISIFNPIREVQLSAEFEELNVSRNWDDRTGFKDENYWYPALFLGAGFNSGPVTVGIRYDVLYDRDKSIYADPWIPFVRVYF